MADANEAEKIKYETDRAIELIQQKQYKDAFEVN